MGGGLTNGVTSSTVSALQKGHDSGRLALTDEGMNVVSSLEKRNPQRSVSKKARASSRMTAAAKAANAGKYNAANAALYDAFDLYRADGETISKYLKHSHSGITRLYNL